MKIQRRKNPLPILGAIAAVILGLAIPLLPPAHAAVPTQCTVNGAGAGQTSVIATNPGDTSVTFKISLGSCGTLGSLFIYSFFFAIPLSKPGFQPTVTDNASDTYVNQAVTDMTRCTSPSLPGSCKGPYSNQMQTFSTTLSSVAAGAGHLAVTIAVSGGTAFPYVLSGLDQWEFWQNVNPTATQSCVGGFNVDSTGVSAFFTSLNGGNPSAACTTTTPINGIQYTYVLYTQSGSSAPTFSGLGGATYFGWNSQGISLNPNNCSTGSFANNICQVQGGVMINGNTQATTASGYQCTGGCTSNSMAVVVTSFGGALTTTGNSGNNVSCNPACPNQGGINTSSSTYLTVFSTGMPMLYFYTAQNGVTVTGNVYDLTTEVAAAHCKKTTCYLFAGIYNAQNINIPPSPANPYILSYSITFPIANGSVNKVLDVAPNVGVPALNYWAVAIFSNSTASRGSGVTGTGTGVSIYGATWSNSMFTTPLSSAAFPAQFNGQGTVQTPPLYFVASLQFQLTFVTVTSTVAGNTTIVTSTATATTLGPGFFSSANNWPVIMLFLFLPAMIFLGATKSIYGGMFGFVMGGAICLVVGVLPAFIFTGIIISTVALAFVARRLD